MYAGYKGGLFDKVAMSINNSFVIMPVLPILLLLNFLLRDKMNWFYMALMMALLGWAYDARLIRAQVLSLKERVFSDTAVFCGMPTRRIILKEHLPYVMPIHLRDYDQQPPLVDRHGGDPFRSSASRTSTRRR